MTWQTHPTIVQYASHKALTTDPLLPHPYRAAAVFQILPYCETPATTNCNQETASELLFGFMEFKLSHLPPYKMHKMWAASVTWQGIFRKNTYHWDLRPWNIFGIFWGEIKCILYKDKWFSCSVPFTLLERICNKLFLKSIHWEERACKMPTVLTCLAKCSLSTFKIKVDWLRTFSGYTFASIPRIRSWFCSTVWIKQG